MPAALFASVLYVLVSSVEATEPRAMTFDVALGLGTETPLVRAAEAAIEQKAGLDARIASIPFNPQIAIQPGWRFAPTNAREPELILEILQPWNFSGYGGTRRRAATAEEDVLRAGARAMALAASLGAARAWIDLWAAEQVLEEAKREETIAGDLELLVGRAATLGEMTRADLAEARAYHAEARLLVLGAEGEVFQRGLLLGKQVGDAGGVPLRTTGDLPEPPVPPASKRAGYFDEMPRLPAVAVHQLRARAAWARDLEEQALRGTGAQLGVAVQRDAPGGLVVSAVARVTFPLFEHGERERGTLRAEAARLEGEQRDALLAAKTDLAGSFHEVDHTAEVLAVVRDDLAPASREAAATRRRIFQEGGATLLEVLQSDRAAVVAASRMWKVRADHAWARVKLWLLLAEVALPVKEEPSKGSENLPRRGPLGGPNVADADAAAGGRS